MDYGAPQITPKRKFAADAYEPASKHRRCAPLVTPVARPARAASCGEARYTQILADARGAVQRIERLGKDYRSNQNGSVGTPTRQRRATAHNSRDAGTADIWTRAFACHGAHTAARRESQKKVFLDCSPATIFFYIWVDVFFFFLFVSASASASASAFGGLATDIRLALLQDPWNRLP